MVSVWWNKREKSTKMTDWRVLKKKESKRRFFVSLIFLELVSNGGWVSFLGLWPDPLLFNHGSFYPSHPIYTFSDFFPFHFWKLPSLTFSLNWVSSISISTLSFSFSLDFPPFSLSLSQSSHSPDSSLYIALRSSSLHALLFSSLVFGVCFTYRRIFNLGFF